MQFAKASEAKPEVKNPKAPEARKLPEWANTLIAITVLWLICVAVGAVVGWAIPVIAGLSLAENMLAFGLGASFFALWMTYTYGYVNGGNAARRYA